MKSRHGSVITSLVLIFAGIVCIIIGVASGLDYHGFKNYDYEVESFEKEIPSDKISSIEVDFGIGDLTIIHGDNLIIDAQDVIKDSLTYEVKDDTLVIKTKEFKLFDFNFNWFNWGRENKKDKNENRSLTVYIPEGVELDNLKIRNGVGNLNIRDISAKSITLDCGVGDSDIDNISAKKIDIDNGVGNFEIKNSELNNLTVDNGVGDVKIDGEITGNCKIDNGVGNIYYYIIGNTEDYSFDVDNGVGEVEINRSSYKNFVNSLTENHFKIDNGVGDINIEIGGN